MNDQIITAIKEEFAQHGLKDGTNEASFTVSASMYMTLYFKHTPKAQMFKPDFYRTTPPETVLVNESCIYDLSISIYEYNEDGPDDMRHPTESERLVILDTLNEIEE